MPAGAFKLYSKLLTVVQTFLHS